MIEIISQIAIPILSGASIWAFAGKRHRLGFICGLCGQPFWLYSTFTGELWGMFVVSLWFTGNHIRGLINHRRDRETEWTVIFDSKDEIKVKALSKAEAIKKAQNLAPGKNPSAAIHWV